jgi:16S rRNA G966 N2-methylase RsmD
MPATEQLAFDDVKDSSGGLKARRAGALYGVHAYHTKIPPEAITSCIEANTRPGDVVLDPFCGSGMTGVAAALVGRRAVLNDLSPAAVHIASNYVTPCDPSSFLAAVQRILASVGGQVAAMYETRHHGRPATIEYVVWSDIRECRSCQTEHLLWDFRTAGLRNITCPRCRAEQPKSSMRATREAPVEANLSTGARARVVRSPDEQDLGLDRIPRGLPWHPTIPFDRTRPMWRRGHADLGIETVADFYSSRNLAAMALLWEAASQEPDDRLRSALRFSLTAIANRASRRYQWNAKRPTNVLGGTLYISSLRYEWNVMSLWRRKVAAVARLFSENPMPPDAVNVIHGSATALPLQDASIDYCFTDPPFGGHIVYSDSSLLWEAWLDDLTDRNREAIVVSTGDTTKSVADYQALLQQSFQEVSRVLKPSGRATVVFQATDLSVWSAVQESARDAGLSLKDATTLEKGQPSFKQIKGRLEGERVASTDVVLTFTKTLEADADQPSHIEDIVASTVPQADGVSLVQHQFAVINAQLLRAGRSPLSFDAVRTLLKNRTAVAESTETLAA